MEETNLTNASKNSMIGTKMPVIDYDDVEFSNQEPNSSTNLGEIPIPLPSCGSMDSIFDEFLRDTHACTHFHTCNHPGPEFPHTHTCVHMHTKIVTPSSNDDSHNNDDFADSVEQNGHKRGRERGGGNREAVRKYRLKKKAYTASLANELVSLRALNQQLMQRLQRQVTLESEVVRLKCLLVDIRGRVEGEIGSFPYQKAVKRGDMHQNFSSTNFPSSCNVPCNVQCGEQVCVRDEGKSAQGREFQKLNCMASLGSPPSFS
ncbi:hypothetical protein RND81_11G150900 [Saponaria officinalis]|uniref:BZIP domain-containing protein n=1 Tax=Saponaria officinalis TaxID=3572 RepID=A0AAW1HLD4_SAPOF